MWMFFDDWAFFRTYVTKSHTIQKYGEIFKLDITLTAKLLILRYVTEKHTLTQKTDKISTHLLLTTPHPSKV